MNGIRIDRTPATMATIDTDSVQSEYELPLRSVTISAREELEKSIAQLFQSSAYSDLTINAKGSEYNVHKAIVLPRSDFFVKALKETNTKNARNDVVTLSEDKSIPVPSDDPDLVRLMIRYLYGLDYLETLGNDVKPVNGDTVQSETVNGNHPEQLVSPSADTNGSKAKTLNGNQADSPSSTWNSLSTANGAKPKTGNQTEPAANGPAPAADSPTSTSSKKKKKSRSKSIAPQSSEDIKNLKSNNPEAVVPPRSTALTHAQMCVIAEYYGISGLRTLAQQNLIDSMAEIWDTPDFVDVLNLGCNGPLEKDKVLQESFVTTIAAHPTLWEKPQIETVLSTKPELTFKLFKHSNKRMSL